MSSDAISPAVMSSDADHPLDRATRLETIGARRLKGRAHPFYHNFAGPFGGATAATLLRAVLEDKELQGDPVALTVNFCGPIAQEEYDVSVRLARGGRTTQHWCVELTQKGVILATASVVCVMRRPSWSLAVRKAPLAPSRATLKEGLIWGAHLPWSQRYALRYAEGELTDPLTLRDDAGPTRTLVWMQDAPERPLDFISLAALSDTFFMRYLLARGGFRPSGTITLTTYFHISAEDLKIIGPAPVLGEADSAIFHDTVHDQSCALWSEDGRLLANGVQLVWFKE